MRVVYLYCVNLYVCRVVCVCVCMCVHAYTKAFFQFFKGQCILNILTQMPQIRAISSYIMVLYGTLGFAFNH